MIKSKPKVVVGLSGGVDSTAALILLQRQGYQPIGVSLKLPVWQCEHNLSRENICCTDESLRTAAVVCHKLGVPYHQIPAQENFRKQVVKYFTSELKHHRTPNPCVICNRYFKFKELLKFAKKIGAPYVATGHYAKVKLNPKTNRVELRLARDKDKDQTYNLSWLTQAQLKKIIFPLQDLTKNEVYKLVAKVGFKNFAKTKQSQDFCYVAGASYNSFLEKAIGLKAGDIVDGRGKKLGRHPGLYFYTIGQRKGIGLGGGPYFVKGFDIKKNQVIVTKSEKEIFSRELILSPTHFISGETLKKPLKIRAKIRYGQTAAPAVVKPFGISKLKVVFSKPQRAITPGQLCAFYSGQVCLGGGMIEKVL